MNKKKLTLSVLTALAVVGVGAALYFQHTKAPNSRSVAQRAPQPKVQVTDAKATTAYIAPVAIAAPKQVSLPKPKAPVSDQMSIQEVLPQVTYPVTNWRQFQPEEIQLVLLPGTPIKFKRTKQADDGTRTTWIGEGEVDNASMVAIATEKSWVSSVAFPNGNEYRVTVSDNGASVEELNPDLETCGTDLEMITAAQDHVAAQAKGDLVNPAKPDAVGVYTIDVTFFYDADVVKSKTPEVIESTIRAMVEQSNLDLTRSKIDNAKWNVVGVYEVPVYDIKGDRSMSADLTAITNSTNPVGAFVKEKEEETGADASVLFVGTDRTYAGLAWTPGRHAVVLWGMTHMTLAHEMGHNLSCSHDRTTEGAKDSDSKYAYGHRWKTAEGYDYGTIMSYAGYRVPYFSNPDIVISGVPYGVASTEPKAADNAKMIRSQVAEQASLRSPPTAPVITTQPTKVSVIEGQPVSLSVTATGGNLTYQWYKGETATEYKSSAFTKYSSTVADSGSYTVRVTNKLGVAQSNTVTVTVSPKTSTAPGGSGGNSGGSSGGGGGGAPSLVYFGLMGALLLIRKFTAKK